MCFSVVIYGRASELWGESACVHVRGLGFVVYTESVLFRWLFGSATLFRCNDVLVFTSEIWSTVEESINLCTLCRVAVHNCIKRISHFENHIGLMLRFFFRRKLMGRYSKQACDFKIMNPFLLIIPCISHQHPTRSRQHLSYYEYQQGLAHDSLVGIMCDKGFKS